MDIDVNKSYDYMEDFRAEDEAFIKRLDEIMEIMKNNEQIEDGMRALQKEIHETAIQKGWWESEKNVGEAIALMHSELSEALEAHRVGNPPDDKIPEFTGLEAEFADCIIRILDASAGLNLDTIGAIFAKMEYNKGREYKHGKNY
jgi:hypothetical protein